MPPCRKIHKVIVKCSPSFFSEYFQGKGQSMNVLPVSRFFRFDHWCFHFLLIPWEYTDCFDILHCACSCYLSIIQNLYCQYITLVYTCLNHWCAKCFDRSEKETMDLGIRIRIRRDLQSGFIAIRRMMFIVSS